MFKDQILLPNASQFVMIKKHTDGKIYAFTYKREHNEEYGPDEEDSWNEEHEYYYYLFDVQDDEFDYEEQLNENDIIMAATVGKSTFVVLED